MGRSFASEASASFSSTMKGLGLGPEASKLGDPRAIGRRAALLAAAMVKWREHLGPLLEATDVEELMGVGTRQAVSDLRTRKRLLGLRRADGRVLYPAFQFGEDGRPFRTMPEILESFERAAVDEWTIASWFVTPQPELSDRAPAGWLAGGGAPSAMVLAARRTAALLAR